MSVLIELSEYAGRRAARPARDLGAGGAREGARILFYTGVRYERIAEGAGCAAQQANARETARRREV